MKLEFDYGLSIEDMADGLLVRQYSEAYIARNWETSAPTVEFIQTALSAGLKWMIREGHPQESSRWPHGRGRVYLAFSPTRENQWSMAIDSYNKKRGDFGQAVFNGKYRLQFEEKSIPFKFEKRNRSAGHLVVKREMVIHVLERLSELDHEVLYLGRSAFTHAGFRTEYDIQRAILFNWSSIDVGANCVLIGDEVPVDNAPNPRRIDILSYNQSTNEYVVIELKRAEALANAVDQLDSYCCALQRQDLYSASSIKGVLIAERIPLEVSALLQRKGYIGYEITYPHALNRVV